MLGNQETMNYFENFRNERLEGDQGLMKIKLATGSSLYQI